MKKIIPWVMAPCLLFLFECSVTPTEPEPALRYQRANYERPEPTVRHVKALVVYAQDANDDYPFPPQEFRERLFSRIRDYYQVMSYGQHQLEFIELSNDGGYFTSRETSTYYREHFRSGSASGVHYDGPFALFNEEILHQVIDKFGEKKFVDIDLIIMLGTDGGPDWYLPNVNAMGFARLGFNFQAAGRIFPANFGGITIEIGSDFIHKLYREAVLYWLFAHEYGHWLGFRKHRSFNIGIYSLMTSRLHADTRFVEEMRGPNPLDPLLLIEFDWLDKNDDKRVQVVHAGQQEVQIVLQPIRSHTGTVLAQICVPGTEKMPGRSNETYENFYLAYHPENASIFDNSYNGSGLLIWHAANDIMLDIECAVPLNANTNLDHLDINEDMQGLPTDFFNSDNGLEFTPDTHPSSNIWGIHNTALANLPSGISLTDVQETNKTLSFKVGIDTTTVGLTNKNLARRHGSKQKNVVTSTESNTDLHKTAAHKADARLCAEETEAAIRPQ